MPDWTSFRSFLHSPEYFLKKLWMLLQSTSFRSFFLFPEYFWTINMDDALMNVIPVIFSFSWIFSNNKNMDVASSNLILIIFVFSWIFLTKNMDFDSVNFIQLIFAVWIFLIDIASIKLIFVFSWEKYSPFKSRTIVESIKTKRKT